MSALVTLAMIGGLTYQVVDDHTRLEDQRRGDERLTLAVDTLASTVLRYVSIPSLVSESRTIIDALANGETSIDLPLANQLLERTAHEFGLSALYVLDRSGVTLAASNWREASSFVGHDYGFRPYFLNAMTDGAAHYYGVGVTTGQPGLFLSAAVKARRDGGTSGIVVAKVDFASLEASWQAAGERIFVADEDHVVILTSVPNSRYRALRPLSSERRDVLRQEQRYAGEQFGDVLDRSRGTTRSAPVPGTDWTLTVETFNGDRRWQAPAMAAIAILAPLVTGLGALSWRQHTERVRADQRAKAELEVRVAARTADLREAMLRIAREAAAREKVDLELQRTRDDLVAAAKLAAIGQAFSGLAHEVNQPLAALKTHLHSTRLLVKRQDDAAALGSIEVMLSAVDRLADLTGNLKRLAYQGPTGQNPLDLCDVTQRVVDLMRYRFVDAEITFEHAMTRPSLMIGRSGRLEQVVMNLLLNAIDAVLGVPERRIRVEVRGHDDRISLTVADTGTGVDSADRSRLFEPFFTTKPKGVGLGLGLAVTRSIVDEHGGTLDYVRTDDGESQFIATFPSTHLTGDRHA